MYDFCFAQTNSSTIAAQQQKKLAEYGFLVAPCRLSLKAGGSRWTWPTGIGARVTEWDRIELLPPPLTPSSSPEGLEVDVDGRDVLLHGVDDDEALAVLDHAAREERPAAAGGLLRGGGPRITCIWRLP